MPKHLVALLVGALLFTTSCSSIRNFLLPEEKDKDARVEWQKTLRFDVNGEQFRGMAILPRAASYKFRIYPYDKNIDRLQWRTCAGFDFVDKAVKRGWFGGGDKYFEMDFAPTAIELDRACSLKIESLSAKKKVMEFGMAIFPDTRVEIDLPARLECNRRVTNYVGKTACHAPNGTIHRIVFQQEVFQDDRPNAECPPMKKIGDRSFEFFMPRNECIYQFNALEKHTNGEDRKFLLHTYGFEKVPPPEY